MVWLKMIGHELRTPLCVIVGNAELLSDNDHIKDDPVLRSQVDAILRTAHRVSALVKDAEARTALGVPGASDAT